MASLQDVVAGSRAANRKIKFRGWSQQRRGDGYSAGLSNLKTAEVAPERSPVNHDLNFNPKNTFERSSSAATTTSRLPLQLLAVAQSPGNFGNPLFLVRRSWLGKTILAPYRDCNYCRLGNKRITKGVVYAFLREVQSNEQISMAFKKTNQPAKPKKITASDLRCS